MTMAKEKMNVSKMSDDNLQDLFAEVFEKEIASLNGVSSYECVCKRQTGSNVVTMEVTIYGMAGSPIIDDWKKNKVAKSGSVVIKQEGRGSLQFKLIPKETVSLNVNDYMIVYRSE